MHLIHLYIDNARLVGIHLNPLPVRSRSNILLRTGSKVKHPPQFDTLSGIILTMMIY